MKTFKEYEELQDLAGDSRRLYNCLELYAHDPNKWVGMMLDAIDIRIDEMEKKKEANLASGYIDWIKNNTATIEKFKLLRNRFLD